MNKIFSFLCLLSLHYTHAQNKKTPRPAPPHPLDSPSSIQLPDIEIADSAHWISSILDEDYLHIHQQIISIDPPTGQPSLYPQPADGTATGRDLEPPLDIQGKIPTQNKPIELALPIKVNKEGRLSAFKTCAKIPAEYTKDGKEATVVLAWDKARLPTYYDFLTIKIYAKDKEVLLKQLDLVAGQGKDQKGIPMTTFYYPKNQKESSQPASSWTGRYILYLISAIPDKNFAQPTTLHGQDPQYLHQFLYVPIMGLDGKIWLNNNLGAGYAHIHQPKHFNPNQQAKAFNDYLAYGSLFQWGRPADGHELMTWGNGMTRGKNPINYPTYRHINTLSWIYDVSDRLIDFTENCPQGWHTPDRNELEELKKYTDSGTLYITKRYFFVGGLRVPYTGNRDYIQGDRLTSTGVNSGIWSSTTNEANTAYRFNSGYRVEDYNRSFGFPIRCLRD